MAKSQIRALKQATKRFITEYPKRYRKVMEMFGPLIAQRRAEAGIHETPYRRKVAEPKVLIPRYSTSLTLADNEVLRDLAI